MKSRPTSTFPAPPVNIVFCHGFFVVFLCEHGIQCCSQYLRMLRVREFKWLVLWPSFILLNFYLMCLSVFCVDVCLWIACLPGPHTGEEKVFNSLDSEVITVLSFDVGAGNQTLVLLNNRQCTEPLSHLSTTCLECMSPFLYSLEMFIFSQR